jgi:DNA modification methylase
VNDLRIIEGDALRVLGGMDAESVQTCITSPPYWGLRDYGTEGQIGLEPTPEEYVEALVAIFREVRRVLRDDGTLWLNLGDSYAGGGHGGGGSFGPERPGWQPRSHGFNDGRANRDKRGGGHAVPGLKPKDLVGIPWRVAFALQADGWYLRSDIIWAKPNPMPESVTDRPTKAHEYLFLLAKSQRYYYDAGAIREPHEDTRGINRFATSGGSSEKFEGGKNQGFHGGTGFVMKPGGRAYDSRGRNRRSVWTIPTQPFSAAHFAVFPPALVEPCILAGAPEGGLVLDPFAGSGTVGVVCRKHRRRFVGIELNPEYAMMARGRLGEDVTDEATAEEMPLFNQETRCR